MDDHESKTEQSRAVVKRLYEAAISRDMETFPRYFQTDVVVVEPAFLPYGGCYEGLEDFLTNCVSQAFLYMDVSSIKLEKLVADGNQVVSFLNVKTRNHDSDVYMSEWFELSEGKVVQIKILFHQLGSLINVIN